MREAVTGGESRLRYLSGTGRQPSNRRLRRPPTKLSNTRLPISSVEQYAATPSRHAGHLLDEVHQPEVEIIFDQREARDANAGIGAILHLGQRVRWRSSRPAGRSSTTSRPSMCAVGSPSVITMICLFAAGCRDRTLRASRRPAWMLVKCWGTLPGGWSRSNRRCTRLS